MLSPGDRVPDFSAFTDDGEPMSASALSGRAAVLYFYPKADTSGCTQEAKEFTELMPAFDAAGVAVFGISPDPVKAQCKFVEKYGIGFPLVADVGAGIAQIFGVWGEKSMYGRKYMGIHRTTFVINADGVITHVFEKVKVAGHAAEILKTVTGDQQKVAPGR